MNAQKCTFIYSLVDKTTCKGLRHSSQNIACTHAQSRFHGNSGSQVASFYFSVMRLRLSCRLRVDRCNRYVGGPSFKCGQKIFVNVYVWTGPKKCSFLHTLEIGFYISNTCMNLNTFSLSYQFMAWRTPLICTSIITFYN